jgi:hypothetical protein
VVLVRTERKNGVVVMHVLEFDNERHILLWYLEREPVA